MYFMCPSMEQLQPLKDFWMFKQNFSRIKRYQELGLDFIVYGEGKVTLFRTNKTVNIEQRRLLFSKFNGICPLCGDIGIPFYDKNFLFFKDSNGETYHIDHIIPVSRGGGRDLFNLQIICPHCNRIKKEAIYG